MDDIPALTARQVARRDQYLRARRPDDGFDWSNQAFLEADDYESRGVKPRKSDFFEPSNGFLWAKMAQDITIAMWKEDIADKLLFPRELLADGYSEKYLRSIGILPPPSPPPVEFELEIEVVDIPPNPEPGLYLTNEQLSELIYRLSLESRRAYDAGFNGEAPLSPVEPISPLT